MLVTLAWTVALVTVQVSIVGDWLTAEWAESQHYKLVYFSARSFSGNSLPIPVKHLVHPR
jgi:hypothetical protein